MNLTPVLFTQKNSVYLTVQGFDCYDAQRDALTFKRGLPIIAHPPCRLWSRMRRFSTAPAHERWLAVWSIIYVRKYGGIVEHPAGSAIFRFMGIPTNGSPDKYGGFLISVDQSWFGHPCRKRTYLYICGISRSQVPAHPLSFRPITSSISRSKHLKELKKTERSSTPLIFAYWLRLIQTIILANRKRLMSGKFLAGTILVYLQVDISTLF